MKKPNVKIYVATHEPHDYLKKIPYSYYIPIYCGKALHRKHFINEYIPELGDDTGDNISDQNAHYSELSALYWIWKNDNSKPNDIIGLDHYSRYFIEPQNSDYDFEINNENINKLYSNLLTKENIIKLIDKYDFIVKDGGNLKDNNYNIMGSAYQNYEECHIIKDLDNALIGIKSIFPKLYPRIYFEVKYNETMSTCNMFITKKKYLNKYCEFLFPVLFYVNKTIDFTDEKYDDYQTRVFGFLSERLFRPWLMTTNYKVTDNPVVFLNLE